MHFLLSVPSLISSPPLQQATHLVSFLLLLSPLPHSNKGANHYNWHHAGQLSQAWRSAARWRCVSFTANRHGIIQLILQLKYRNDQNVIKMECQRFILYLTSDIPVSARVTCNPKAFICPKMCRVRESTAEHPIL